MISGFGTMDGKLEKIEDLRKVAPYIKHGVVWIDCLKPTKEELSFLEKEFKLHHLALEDSMNENQRAKVERYDEFHYIVIHSITETEKLETTQLNLFVFEKMIVSVHLKHLDFIEEMKKKVVENPYLILKGPDHIAYLLLDASADQLFPMMDKLEETIDRVEESVFRQKAAESGKTMNTLFNAKKQLLHLRKITWPQMEVLNVLSSGELKYISRENLIYYRDVYDHLIRINSIIETQRELVSGAMEGNLMVQSNNLNKVVKKLTAITAIIMLPSLIVGVYGSNFHFIPELQWEYGFYGMLASALVTTILLAIYFKQRDWV